MFPVNFTAVIVAALANFVIGFLLHGPVLGKVWMKLANVHPTGKEKFSDMLPQMGKNLLANVVFAFGLAVVIALAATSSLVTVSGVALGILCGFGVWLAFCVPATAMDVIWMGRSAQLWGFEIFASLVSILAMGAILGAWPA